MLCDELEVVGCTINDEEKIMYVLTGLDESFNKMYSKLIEKMLTKKITIDDAK